MVDVGQGAATDLDSPTALREELARRTEVIARLSGELPTQEDGADKKAAVARGDSEELEHRVAVLREANQHLLVAAVDAQARSDVAARDKEQMLYAAHFDSLTDLPNRLLLIDRVSHSIRLAHRHGSKLAILFLDLDRFKDVNDSLGHTGGDQLLQSVAQRLMVSIRSADTVARFGGDEFVVLLSEITDADAAALSAEKIRRAIASPHPIASQELVITASVGISIYPDDGLDVDSLLQRADSAMYYAKSKGRNNQQFFRPERPDLALSSSNPRDRDKDSGDAYFPPRAVTATIHPMRATGQPTAAAQKPGLPAGTEHQLNELRQANEHLVVAAIRAHTLTEASESQLRLLVKEVTDCAIYMLGLTGDVISWNKGAQRITGYVADEIVGLHFSRFYSPEDVAAGAPLKALETATHDGHYETEGFSLRKDGSRFWASVVIDAIRGENNELLGFAQITRDLSERQEVEKLLKERAGELRSLSHFLLNSADNERSRLATELHDELGSQIIAVSIDILALEKSVLENFPGLAQRLEEIRQGVVRANALNRQTTEQLNPSILEILGLVPAIASLCHDYRLRTRQECTFTFSGDPLLGEAKTSLTVYRIVQEALNHLSQEGGVISVNLRRADGMIRLSVIDNDVHLLKYRTHAWPPSVAQMRERASLVGGSFGIKLDPTGKRAVIEAEIPDFPRLPMAS
ncbi:MAG: diguanylate cyclase [Burkholderiaceae bacterium]